MRGYIREVNARVCFSGRSDRRRAVLVKMAEVKQTLTVEDFPQPSMEEGYGSGDWQD